MDFTTLQSTKVLNYFDKQKNRFIFAFILGI